MKYLLWFFIYVCNNESHQIRTYVLVERDSISFYVYDGNIPYPKWKIEEKFEEHYHEARYAYASHTIPAIFKGIYIISYQDIKGIVYITDSYADITITGENVTEHIQLYKLEKKKLKHRKK